MNTRLAAIPLALVLGTLLTGCGDNASACTTFETAYNKADLRDKKLFTDFEDHNESLYELAASAESAEEVASGGVKEGLESFTGVATSYRYDQENANSSYDTLELRVLLDESRDEIVDACGDGSNAISLEEDHPPK